MSTRVIAEEDCGKGTSTRLMAEDCGALCSRVANSAATIGSESPVGLMG